jgi:hypothetical protein
VIAWLVQDDSLTVCWPPIFMMAAHQRMAVRYIQSCMFGLAGGTASVRAHPLHLGAPPPSFGLRSGGHAHRTDNSRATQIRRERASCTEYGRGARSHADISARLSGNQRSCHAILHGFSLDAFAAGVATAFVPISCSVRSRCPFPTAPRAHVGASINRAVPRRAGRTAGRTSTRSSRTCLLRQSDPPSRAQLRVRGRVCAVVDAAHADL